MKPAHPDPAEILPRVRQQLILAQVRIMELEDVRDETASRLEEAAKALQQAQALADQKLDEAAHSERVRADLQGQFEQLQQIQRAASAALDAARAQHRTVEQDLEKSHAEAAARQARLEQVEAELRRLKSTRSWRWTAWLRALGGKSS